MGHGRGSCEVCDLVDNVYLTAKRAVDLHDGKHETLQTLAIFVLCTTCAKDVINYTEDTCQGILQRNTFRPSYAHIPLDTLVTNEQETDVAESTDAVPRLSEIALKAVAVRIVFGAEQLTLDRTNRLSYVEKRGIVEIIRKLVDIKSPQLASQLAELLWNEQVDEFTSMKSGITLKDVSLLSSIAKYTKIPTMYLSWNKLSGPSVGQALRSMVSSGNIQELDLAWNQLGSVGALHMATALSAPTCRLEYLNMSSNKLGPTGTTHIARALRNNRHLRKLNLSFNDMGFQGAAALAEMLAHNRTMQSLNLRNNEIGQRGAEVLAGALKRNMTLRELVVVDNHIGEKGAVALAQFLRTNVPKLLQHIGGEGYYQRQEDVESERRSLKLAD